MSVLGYGFLTAVLLASMYASHTLIAYPITVSYTHLDVYKRQNPRCPAR